MATRSPVVWKKRILIPFWILRICITVFILAIYAWAVKVLRDDPNKWSPSIVSIVFFMLFIIAVLLLDVLAILLFLRDALHPGTFLVMNCFQTGFWIGVLIMDIVAVARGESAVGLGFSVFVFLTFLALLIYAYVGYSRNKKEAQRGNYAPAHNPAATPTPGYHPPAYMNAAPYAHQDTAYSSQPAPQYQLGGTATSYYAEQPTKPAQMV